MMDPSCFKNASSFCAAPLYPHASPLASDCIALPPQRESLRVHAVVFFCRILLEILRFFRIVIVYAEDIRRIHRLKPVVRGDEPRRVERLREIVQRTGKGLLPFVRRDLPRAPARSPARPSSRSAAHSKRCSYSSAPL